MTTGFKEQFISFITESNLFTTQDRLLVGCSGGVDSMVLCHLLHELNYRFEVAHVNYRLRQKSSDYDEQFVSDFCQQHSIPFHNKQIFERPKGNVQAWARAIRYEFFETIRQKQQLDFVLTAHHFDDQVETFLLNFSRGTGLAGLIGIQDHFESIRRPLLFARKNELIEYASKKNINWREDASNDSDEYARNKIRHHIIPVLDEIRENDEGMRKSLQNLKQSHHWMDDYFNQRLAIHKTTLDEWTFELNRFNTNAGQFELFMLLRSLGFNYDQVGQMMKSNRTGTYYKSETHVASIDRGVIRCRANFATDFKELRINDVREPIEIKIGPHIMKFNNDKGLAIEKSTQKAYFDYDLIQWPLTIRPWRAGDKFKPFGMYGKQKKVSDLLVQLKLSYFEKEETMVLLDGNDNILWVAGYRRSIHAPITAQTESRLVVQLIQ